MPNEFFDTPPVSSFVGRDSETRYIQEFLSNEKISNNPILLVHGARGIGKTSLVSFVVRKHKDNFELIWIDRSMVLELFEEVMELKETTSNNKSIKPSSKSEKNNSPLNSAKKILLNQSPEKPFLLIIDDFDEENNLSDENNGFALCSSIEKFVKHPNKVILTSRLHKNNFRHGYNNLEVGLLQKQDITLLVNKCFENIDKVVLVNQNLNDTSDYIWTLSGGLPEFISRCVVPVAIQKEFLLGRDPRYTNIFNGFSQCYVKEREQPRSLEGYDLIDEGHKEFLQNKIEQFEDARFAGFLLWKWVRLNLTESCTVDALGMLLGLNLVDNEIISKFHATLLELYKHRFVARQFEGNTSRWILLPIIASYLRQCWPAEDYYWNDEAIYLSDFIKSNIDTPLRIIQHVERILEILTWCNDNKSHENAILLGVSAIRAFTEINLEEIPDSLDISTLINISNKLVDILEQQVESNVSSYLVEVLLTLANLHSFSRIHGSRLLAHGFATKALNLAREKKIDKEFDAIIVTAKTHIFLGELDKAGELLEEANSKNKVNGDWTVVVFLLIQALRIHVETNNLSNIYSWYRKIVDTIAFHKKVDIALQSAIDASKYCYTLSSPDEIADILTKAVELLKQDKNYIKEFPFLSIQVLAYCAFTYERKKDVERYKSLLQDASQACKEFGFEKHPIFNSIDKRLTVVTEQGKDKTLFDELVMITSNESNISYGFDDLFEICPICRKPLGTIEIISCTSCDSRYHKTCLMNINVFSCLSCSTDFNFTTKE